MHDSGAHSVFYGAELSCADDVDVFESRAKPTGRVLVSSVVRVLVSCLIDKGFIRHGTWQQAIAPSKFDLTDHV